MNNLQLTSVKTALITLGLFFCFSFAQEADPLSNRQKAVISALDSIEENALGFAVGGGAKGGILSSILSSKDFEDSFSEYSAFSDLLLSISIRPSNETKATFDLRFHKDWQSAYREGANVPIIRWWSYDGRILDKKLKFNLGTMRTAYTPLTLYLPEPSLIMEPEIFVSLKRDAMEERYLDGTNRRLLQGLNVEYGTSAGMFDNIFVQGTIARLRKVADGIDRTFFDFDPNKDRFAAAARIGIETFGFYAGINDAYTFNRFNSSLKTSADSIIDYEKNNVLSFELNYNSKKLLSGPIAFGIGAEYALSNWAHWQHEKTTADSTVILSWEPIVDLPSITSPDGSSSTNYYLYYKTIASAAYKHKLSKVEELENKGALLGNAFVSYNGSPFEIKLSGHFLNTDKEFEAELAASPAYLPNLDILNSDVNLNSALAQFRSASLENMYYSLYYTLPLNMLTVIDGQRGKPSSNLCKEANLAACLDNNYKLAHYYRNAYTQQTYTRLERDSIRSGGLDPAVNTALPYGYATPDRSGGDVDLSFAWNKAISLRGVFGMYSSEAADYTRFGGGLEVNAAKLIGLSKALIISGSYEQNKEEKGVFNPQIDRIMAGFKVGIWRGLSLTGGFQQLTKEFKNPYVISDDPDSETGFVAVNKTSEVLAIGGPQVKISEKAEFSLQGGLLSNSIEGNNGRKLDLDKYIMSGMVTVKF